MKFGRILRDSPDGKIARLVVVEPEKGRVIDLARAAALHLRDQAPRDGLPRPFPGSMAQALSMGNYLTDHAPEIGTARGDDAALDINSVEWLPASDPPVLRDAPELHGPYRQLEREDGPRGAHRDGARRPLLPELAFDGHRQQCHRSVAGLYQGHGL